MMGLNLIKEGQLKILKHLESLEKGWDGYDSVPITKEALDKFCDMSHLNNIITKFRHLDFLESDIYVVPVPNGEIQLEAESKTRYVKITLR